MKKLPLAKASRPLADYTAELDGEILVVTRGRRPVAALIPLHEIDTESRELARHPDFRRLIERSRKELGSGQSLTFGQIRKRARPSAGGSQSPVRSARKRRRA